MLFTFNEFICLCLRYWFCILQTLFMYSCLSWPFGVICLLFNKKSFLPSSSKYCFWLSGRGVWRFWSVWICSMLFKVSYVLVVLGYWVIYLLFTCVCKVVFVTSTKSWNIITHLNILFLIKSIWIYQINMLCLF